MSTRRDVLKAGALATTTLAVPVACTRYLPSESPSLQPRKVQRALVLWFSQTGNTARIGRLMAAVWKQRGVAVEAAELRDFDPTSIGGYDLVAMGSPVNHYDLPEYVKDWLKNLPPLSRIPVAAFVTHGIPESNSHNTACSLLDLLAQNGAVPMGLATFGNLGTYPPYWAFYPDKAIAGSAYPNGDTFAKARQYAAALIDGVEAGAAYSYRHEIGLGDVKKNLAPIWFSKLITDVHTIDKKRCIGCGTCQDMCPTGAIDPSEGIVDKSRCVDCMGCINNCPAQAVHIVYWGKKLTGYRDFLKQHGITIMEPIELARGDALLRA